MEKVNIREEGATPTCITLAKVNLGCLISPVHAATHGTGVNFGNLATQVTKLELISGRGEVSM